MQCISYTLSLELEKVAVAYFDAARVHGHPRRIQLEVSGSRDDGKTPRSFVALVLCANRLPLGFLSVASTF